MAEYKLTAEEKKIIKLYREGKPAMLNYLMEDLFNAVTEDNLLKQVGDKLWKNGSEISEAEIGAYASEAKQFLKTMVWQELYDSLRVAANRKMYIDSTTFDDMYFGKAMLWSIDVIKQKLENLSKMK